MPPSGWMVRETATAAFRLVAVIREASRLPLRR
jgi:hypothetical protein